MDENIRHAKQKAYQKGIVYISNYNEGETAEIVTVRKIVSDFSKDVLNNVEDKIVTVTLKIEEEATGIRPVTDLS